MTTETTIYSPFITNILENVDWRLNYAKRQLDVFAGSIPLKPFEAIQNDSAFIHAVAVEVWTDVRTNLTRFLECGLSDVNAVAKLSKVYTDRVLDGAEHTSSERSTSPLSNYARRLRLAAEADVVKFLRCT